MKEIYKEVYMKWLSKLMIVFVVGVLTSCTASQDEVRNETCEPINNYFDTTNIPKLKIPDGVNGDKGVMEWVNDRLSRVVRIAGQKVFETFSKDSEFKDIINVCVVLSIMLYAMTILLGMTQPSAYGAMMFLLKIMIVYNLATNYKYFDYYVIQTFEAGVKDLINNAGAVFSNFNGIAKDKSLVTLAGGLCKDLSATEKYLTCTVDDMLSQFLSFKMIKLAFALMASGITSMFYGLMLILFSVFYMLSMLIVFKVYFLALVARFVLYAVSPIFLTFALFGQTKSLFDGWVDQLVNFTIKPIMLFIFAGMFQMILSNFTYNMYVPSMDKDITFLAAGGSVTLTKTYCVKAVAESITEQDSDGKTITKTIPVYKVCQKLQGSTTQNCKDDPFASSVPLDVWMMISGIMICYLMFAMTGWVDQVSAKLSSGIVTLSDVNFVGFDKVKAEVKTQAKQVFNNALK